MPEDHSHEVGRRTFLKTTGAAGAAAAVGSTTVTAGRQPGPKPNEIVVGLYASTSIETAEASIQQSLPESTNVVHRNDSLGYLAAAPPESVSSQARDRLKQQLRAREDVKFVEDNFTVSALDVDDPLFGDQYALDQINAVDAWERTRGSQNIEIAIIDSGVNWSHEDLADQFGSTKGEDIAGSGGTPPESGQDHGTHVAGIAAATANNGTGVAGISDSRLYSVRSLGSREGSLTDVADGVVWALEQGVDIINMSLGAEQSSDLLKQTVSTAYDDGILIVCGAGNDGERDSVNYPAAYDECIAVSALTEGEDIADISSRGPEVEIAAPGKKVLSTLPGDDYGEFSGTSMACPAVAGVAAIGFEYYPSTSNEALRARLKETARDVGLPETQQGAGCVDANALLGPIPPPVIDIRVSDDSPTVDQEITLEAVIQGPEVREISWLVQNAPDGSGETHTVSWREPGAYQVVMEFVTESGETETLQRYIEVTGVPTPTAEIDASTTEPSVGEEVELNGTGSSSPNGDIVEYRWNAEPGGSATGATAVLTRREPVAVDVTLTVEDEDGETASTTRTVEFENDSTCGEERTGGSADGSITWWNSRDRYSYSLQSEEPCQLTVDLDGPRDADFDLYVTLDGRRPSPTDYDRSSETPDANEQVVIDDPGDVREIRILVEGVSGWGSYTVSAEELSF